MRVLVLCLVVMPAAGAEAPRVLVFGDSLSAAYGIDKSAGWVALLQDRLREHTFPHEVINLSISGETSAGGLRRLPAALERYRPTLVLLELGANDGLRGQPLAQMRDNLAEMVRRSRAVGAQVLIFEMRIPSNYGPRYTEAFHSSFGEVSERAGATLVPFFLRAIATDPSQFLDDGIHPNEAAQVRLLDAVWPHVEALLPAAAAARLDGEQPRLSP